MLCDVTVIYVRCVNKLYFRSYSCLRADKGLVNIYSFELFCKAMSLFNCIVILRDYERFLVQSKKKTGFDCRQCHEK